MDEVIFLVAGWEHVARIIVVGTLAYISVVLLIRTSIKRSLAQFSAFDFVITIALGSAFGRILTAKEVGVVEAVTAFTLLTALQFLLAAAERRWPRFEYLVKSPPTLLFYQGQYIKKAMQREKVLHTEIEAAVRKEGLGSLEHVEAVVMESDGNFAIIQREQIGDGSILRGVTERLQPPWGMVSVWPWLNYSSRSPSISVTTPSATKHRCPRTLSADSRGSG